MNNSLYHGIIWMLWVEMHQAAWLEFAEYIFILSLTQ